MVFASGSPLAPPPVESLTAEGIATAVWTHVLESTLTAEQIQRILLAGIAGKRVGLVEEWVPGTTEEYFARDGVTPRITFAPTDAAGNGTPTVDGS